MDPSRNFRLGVLVSGSGSNLQSLIDTFHEKGGGVEIALVISDNEQAYGLERARASGIPTAVFPLHEYSSREEHDLAMAAALMKNQVDLVVLAGYMLIVTPVFLQHLSGRVINLHPSLLPAFPGGTPIEDTLAYGARVTGVTVHYVDEGTDTGPIILQEPLEIQYNDTVESLRERIHKVEHRILPRAVRLIASGKVRLTSGNGRRVIIEEAANDTGA